MIFEDIFKNNKPDIKNQSSKRNFSTISKCRKAEDNFKKQNCIDPKTNHGEINQRISIIDHGAKDYK